jgi:xylulokinase
MIRSLIEGVSYSQKDCLDIIERMGVDVTSVRASGGGARSPFWRQMLADVFGKRVVVLESEEGSAYGAALLALAGTGDSGSVAEVSRNAVRIAAQHETQPDTHAAYLKRHSVYQSLYPALKGFFRSGSPADGQ